MVLYIIRHGQTDWNLTFRLQGQTDIPLNQCGIDLALLTGRGMKGLYIDRCICSPLTRAKQTAELVMEGRGASLPMSIDERIREISFGDMEGTSARNEEYMMPHPEKFNFLEEPDRYERPPHGENIPDVIARTGDFLRSLEKEAGEDETILISSHGCAVRALEYNIVPKELCDFWSPGVPPNCSVAKAVYRSGVWTMEWQDRVFA